MRKFVIGFITFLALLFISNNHFGEQQTASNDSNVLAMAPETESIDPVTSVSAQVINVLEQAFCSPRVCAEADWQQWIIVTPDDSWEVEELVVLSDILATTIESLDQQGLDGRTLLSGYRFKRQHGEYLVGYPGRIAVVNHNTQEITLADAAFKRLHGFYIIHELGHVVDQRTDRQLSATFHTLVGSDQVQRATADGYWMRQDAEQDLEEAAADAFALWIMSNYAEGFRPVFAHTPLTTDYEGITLTLSASLDTLALPQ